MTYQMQLRDERRQGRAEGRVEGRMEAYVEMYKKGMFSLEVAVESSGLSKEEFLKLAEAKSNNSMKL